MKTNRIGAIAIASALALSASGCPFLQSHVKPPKVALKGVQMTGIDFQHAMLRADLEVTNQVPVALSVAKIHWGVKIEGNQLATGEISTPITVAGNGVTPVAVPFDLKFEDLYKIQQKYKDEDEAPYHLDGSLEISTPVGPVTVPFAHDGKVPVLKVPVVDLTKVDVRGVSITGATVRFSFAVKNPNNFLLAVHSLDYSLDLAGSKIAEGSLPSALDLAAKGAGSFDTDVKINFAQAREAATALAGKSQADYSLGGNLSAKTPWGDVSSPFTKSGSVKIQR